ncbi:MAG TPA: hypothetical protein VH879_10970 [Gemmatimonadales bacterium]|jgi:hypothetical protein
MPDESLDDHPSPASWVAVIIAWILVGVPLLWGISITFRKAAILFR